MISPIKNGGFPIAVLDFQRIIWIKMMLEK